MGRGWKVKRVQNHNLEIQRLETAAAHQSCQSMELKWQIRLPCVLYCRPRVSHAEQWTLTAAACGSRRWQAITHSLAQRPATEASSTCLQLLLSFFQSLGTNHEGSDSVPLFKEALHQRVLWGCKSLLCFLGGKLLIVGKCPANTHHAS